jgi:hypothetical protein
MSFYTDKVRKYWFPFIILMIIVLAVGWILAGVIYPSNVQGNDSVAPSAIPPTPTKIPTSRPTATPTVKMTSTMEAVAATATPTYNCTYSAYYWSTHADNWVIENLLLGNLSYTKNEALEIMMLEEPTPTERLMGQFFAALLNTLKGADSFEIDAVIVKARDWLILKPHGVDLSLSEVQEIESYTEQLSSFNLGLIGPGRCVDEPATATPSATDTPTATATYTPGPDLPFFTATATRSSGGGGRPRPTNTQGPPPPATSTPKPPATEPPRPTPTPVVPPTPAPTKPPPTEAPPPAP